MGAGDDRIGREIERGVGIYLSQLKTSSKGLYFSTTLADLFMPFRFGDLSSAVRASLRSWLNDEIDDGLAHGRQARLGRWHVDSFFSIPLVRDGDTGGMRNRSWS